MLIAVIRAGGGGGGNNNWLGKFHSTRVSRKKIFLGWGGGGGGGGGVKF